MGNIQHVGGASDTCPNWLQWTAMYVLVSTFNIDDQIRIIGFRVVVKIIKFSIYILIFANIA